MTQRVNESSLGWMAVSRTLVRENMLAWSFLPLAALLLISLLVARPLAAQPAENVQGVFSDQVEVRVVDLEVVVTRGGERVTGLTADDFVLRVDGQERQIEFFSEVAGGRVMPQSSMATDSRSGSAVPALEPGKAVATRFLVFVDDLMTLPSGRNRVLKNLQGQLARLGPEDSMAIVAFNGRSLDMLTSWTRSERELTSALRQARDRPARGLKYRAQEQLARDIRRGDAARGFSGFSRRGEQSFNDARSVVSAAASAVRAFGQPEGRKVLLLLAGAWPGSYSSLSAGPAAINYGDLRDNQRLFSPLVDAANLLGYTVYPVDLQGAESAGALVDASAGSIREANYRRQVVRNQEYDRESLLFTLADETGGRALIDGAAQNLLGRVSDDTRSYYWLGFSPDWQANDVRHRVDVELKVKGKVRVRQSFSDLSAGTEATLELESAQLLDLPLSGAGQLAVSTGTPNASGFRKAIVPLEVEVPLDWATFLPTGDGWAAQLELRVAVTDDRGDRADIPVIPFVLKNREQPIAGQTEIFVTSLMMRKRPHRLLVSLHDVVTGEQLSGRLEVRFDT